MTADDYVLPLPLRDQRDDELSAETIFAHCRRRYSITSQVSSGAGIVSARVASPSMSLSSMRTSSRVSSGAGPPSSFRFPKPPTTLDHGSASSQRGLDSPSTFSSPPLAAPLITKRRSSLALNGMAKTTRSTSQSISSHGSGVYSRNNIPSTPISTTPSLTFSHSRNTSRSDSPSFPSMGNIQQYNHRPESDVGEARYYNGQPRVRGVASVGRLRASSYSTMAKGKWKCQEDELRPREDPFPEDSFLPGTLDGKVVTEEIRPFVRTTAISFQQRAPRNPDKVAHLLGEEYQQLQRNAVRGKLEANSTLSLSSASKPGFKSLFSTMKSKLKKEDEPAPFDALHGIEEDLFRYGHVIGRKSDAQVHIISQDRSARGIRDLFPDGESSGIVQTKQEDQWEEEGRDAFPRAVRQRSVSVTLDRQADPSFNREPQHSSSQWQQRRPLAPSTRHKEEDLGAKSFLRFDGGESEDDSHSEASLDSPTSSKHSEQLSRTSAATSPRESPNQMRTSHSIDALYAMLEPWASHQSAAPANKIAAPARSSTTVTLPTSRAPDKRLPAVPSRKDVEEPIAAIPLSAPLLGPKAAKNTAQDSSLRLEDIPALTSQVEQCLVAEAGQHCNVWGNVKERSKLLSATSSRDVIPMSWSAYVKAYARGDFDISSPPHPRSAPLVNRAIPRSPRMDAAQWSTSSLNTTISSPGASSLLTSKESFHSLRSNWESPSAKPSNSSRDALTAPTSPSQLSLRSRISTPRLGGLRKMRSRDPSHEPRPTDAEDEDESIRLQAEELVAVGGFGDLRAPRPSWDERRSRCAQLYATLFPDPMSRLSSIVSQLKDRLDVSHASVQLLLKDESVIIASTDADEHSNPWLQDDDSNTPRPGNHSKCQVLSRDCSLDAHALLQRDGRPVVLSDTSQDWRFDYREDCSRGLCFYAGVSVLALGSGLPIGTISVTSGEARVLVDGEKKVLEEAARDVERELEWLRRNETQKRLKEMEASLTSWTKERSLRPMDNTLADRRRMGYGKSMQIKTKGLHGQETAALNSALDAIFVTLQAEVVFVARIGSNPLSSRIVAQRQIGGQSNVKIKPNPAMHLCALAAHKSGLYFDDDADQVRQLLGHESPLYASAASVGCGLKEGGKAYRGTEGWVLTVVARLQGRRLGAESRLYLKKFARPIATLLLALEEQEEYAEKESRASSQTDISSPTKISSPMTKSPGTPRFISDHAESPAPFHKRSTITLLSSANSLSRKKLPPLASPPPLSPLPLLPDEHGQVQTRGLSVYST